jgi:hypothetical protein
MDSWKRDLRGLKRSNHLWTNIVTNCLGQIPWTYSGQWIDMEDTDEKCGDIRPLGLSEPVRTHLVKSGP